jgi:hypothetical protein
MKTMGKKWVDRMKTQKKPLKRRTMEKDGEIRPEK